MLLLVPVSISAQVSIDGTARTPIEIVPDASTGLSKVYVLDACSPTTVITYQSKNTTTPTWLAFGQLGAAYAEPIEGVEYAGALSRLRNLKPDCGYVIQDGQTITYFWIVDYSTHELRLNSLSLSPESDCQTTTLQLDGDAGAIYYYNINGRRIELSRDLSLSYTTMEYSSEVNGYIEKEECQIMAHADGAIHATSSLCDTDYSLSGDRFLKAWGLDERSVSTDLINVRRVEAHTEAEQITETYDNQQKVSSGDDGSALGGSAPVDISFLAQVTPGAIFTEWQLSDYPEFDIISLRDNNLEFSRTFRDAGTTYVRFVAADADGSCEYYSPVYQVNIGESDLHCPNAFSPQGSPGINDEWRVSYRSITEFKCSIFNRWGICVATLTHPSQGWDGKYKGKYVGSGVYYYVIKARGADGRQYNLKGDINIINYNNESGQTTSAPAM